MAGEIYSFNNWYDQNNGELVPDKESTDIGNKYSHTVQSNDTTKTNRGTVTTINQVDDIPVYRQEVVPVAPVDITPYLELANVGQLPLADYYKQQELARNSAKSAALIQLANAVGQQIGLDKDPAHGQVLPMKTPSSYLTAMNQYYNALPKYNTAVATANAAKARANAALASKAMGIEGNTAIWNGKFDNFANKGYTGALNKAALQKSHDGRTTTKINDLTTQTQNDFNSTTNSNNTNMRRVADNPTLDARKAQATQDNALMPPTSHTSVDENGRTIVGQIRVPRQNFEQLLAKIDSYATDDNGLKRWLASKMSEEEAKANERIINEIQKELKKYYTSYGKKADGETAQNWANLDQKHLDDLWYKFEKIRGFADKIPVLRPYLNQGMFYDYSTGKTSDWGSAREGLPNDYIVPPTNLRP